MNDESRRRQNLRDRWVREGRWTEVEKYIDEWFKNHRFEYRKQHGREGGKLCKSKAFTMAVDMFPPIAEIDLGTPEQVAERIAKDKISRREERGERSRLRGKQKLLQDAGSSTDREKWIEWVLHWVAVAESPEAGKVAWEKIDQPPPGRGAVPMLEQAALDPKFLQGLMSKGGAKADGGGLDGSERAKEQRSIEELRKRLAEMAT